MIVGIHQPNYLPWLGYFYKMSRCQAFVYLDNVQFARRLYTHRVRIKTHQGPMWLTIPVKKKGKYHQNVGDVQIDNSQPWQRKHWHSITMNYRRAPFYSCCKSLLEPFFQEDWHMLADFNIHLIRALSDALELKPTLFRASEMGVEGHGTDLLLNICKALGAKTYISGSGGRKYIENERFIQEGIELIYSSFLHPEYRQMHGSFEPGLSIIDFLFNVGVEAAGKWLTNRELDRAGMYGRQK